MECRVSKHKQMNYYILFNLRNVNGVCVVENSSTLPLGRSRKVPLGLPVAYLENHLSCMREGEGKTLQSTHDYTYSGGTFYVHS